MLVYPPPGQTVPAGQPGLHALIVGVSQYTYLDNSDAVSMQNTPSFTFGMKQLSSTALTGYSVYQWLLENKDNLPVPLASIRLLLSPQAEEVQAEPAMLNLGASATLDNFLATAWDWRQDARSHPDNITFFYFAGHGIQRSKEDSVLLLEGFGDGKRPVLHHAVNMHDIFYGMSPVTDPPDIANTQFYFVDACRNQPSQIANFASLPTSNVFNNVLGGRDDRKAPIFYATVANTTAGAFIGKQTIFSRALFQCLNTTAATVVDETATGEAVWGVTVNSLNEALGTYFNALPEKVRGDQDFTISGLVRNALLHKLDGPPDVDVLIEVDPNDAGPVFNIEVRDSDSKMVWNHLCPVNPYPFRGRLKAGNYQIRIHFADAGLGYVTSEKIRTAKLPPAPWKFKVK